MKYKKILTFFLIGLPLSVMLRFMQLYFTIDADTGFYKQEFENYSIFMLIIILAFSAFAAIFSFSAHRYPSNPPNPNVLLSISALCLGFSLLLETKNELFSISVPAWQRVAILLAAIAAGICFIVFAINGIINIVLPKVLYIIPTIYLVIRCICFFSSISSLAIISDNIILTGTYIVSLIFMLEYAKLYNSTDGEYNFRKLLAFGLTSSIMCFTQSIPHFIMNFINDFKYQHTSMEANVSIFFMGAYILIFVLSHFSYKNSCE